jgi:hypothetical protein
VEGLFDQIIAPGQHALGPQLRRILLEQEDDRHASAPIDFADSRTQGYRVHFVPAIEHSQVDNVFSDQGECPAFVAGTDAIEPHPSEVIVEGPDGGRARMNYEHVELGKDTEPGDDFARKK